MVAAAIYTLLLKLMLLKMGSISKKKSLVKGDSREPQGHGTP